MSKVKIEGHGTGTGTFTVTTPSSNTDRTITLPDATGTLLNSDGSAANLTNLPSEVEVSATAPSSPAQGNLWFNSSANTVSNIPSKDLAVYNGTAWDLLSNAFDISVEACRLNFHFIRNIYAKFCW